MKKLLSILVSIPLILVLAGCSSDDGPTELVPEGPKVAISPQPYVYFGQIPAGQKASRSFNITNTGGQTLVVSDLVIGGADAALFSLIDISPPLEIEAYKVEKIDVEFQPSDIGAFEASISIVSNAQSSPDNQNFVGNGSSSASGAIYFERIFRGGGGSVRVTLDNGYVLAGSMSDTITLDPVGALTRMDKYGNTNWIKGYDGTATARFTDMVETDDGGYVAVGRTGSSITSKQSVYIVRTDGDGNMIWETIHSLGTGNDDANSVDKTTDGGFIIAGNTQNTEGGDNVRDALLVKVDASGTVSWSQRYGSLTEGEDAKSVVETNDQDYVFTGSQTTGATGFDLYMVRVNADGTLRWEKKFGGSNWEVGNSVISDENGDFIATGYTISEGAGGRDVYLINVDSAGVLNWSRTYGGGSDDQAEAVIRTDDQGYLMAGVSESFGNLEQVYLVKTDDAGNLLWEKTYGGADDDGANAAQLVKNEGYIIAGYTRSYTTGNEALLLKVNYNGEIE